jgi:hypothetical protein
LKSRTTDELYLFCGAVVRTVEGEVLPERLPKRSLVSREVVVISVHMVCGLFQSVSQDSKSDVLGHGIRLVGGIALLYEGRPAVHEMGVGTTFRAQLRGVEVGREREVPV